MAMDCYTVSQLNSAAKTALGSAFGEDTWVVGEIHGFKLHERSGHVYFDLVEKDACDPGQYVAKIGCAFFKGSFLAWRTRLKIQGLSSFSLADGLEIKIRGGVDLFVKEGRYQIIVNDIDASYSLGAIARKRQQTIDELKRLGLMERNKQVYMTDCPLNVGLITSVGSAAYNDFTSVLNASGFSFRLTVFNAYMQGEHTTRDVSRGIRALEAKGVDVIAIVRGGGARTDLFHFDEMAVCTAIANCTVPVLTGIGHEIDLSVADMVAHSRFVTPTDTARFLASMIEAFWLRVDKALAGLEASAAWRLGREGEALKMLAYRISVAVSRMTKSAESSLHSAGRGLGMAAVRIHSAAENALNAAGRLLEPASSAVIRAAWTRLNELDKMLGMLDPGTTMKRGFSITTGRDGRPLTDAEAAETGDRLRTILFRGSVTSIVESRESE